MRSPTFFQLLTLEEKIALPKAHLKSGPVETQDPVYRKASNDDRFYVGTGNVSSLTQVSSYVRPQGATESNGKAFEPGHLLTYDLRQFSNSPLPAVITLKLLDPKREDDLILYRFSLPSGRGKEAVLGHVLTDAHHRLLHSDFEGAGQAQYAAFRDMQARVAWEDAEKDPLPEPAEQVKMFDRLEGVATAYLAAEGMKVVRMGDLTDAGTPYGYGADKDKLFAVPAGDQDLLRGVTGADVTEIAGLVATRRLAGMSRIAPQAAEPVRAALTVLATDLDRKAFGRLPDPINAAFGPAKYALLDMSHDDSAWAPVLRRRSEEELAALGEALCAAFEGGYAEKAPQTVQTALAEMRTVLDRAARKEDAALSL